MVDPALRIRLEGRVEALERSLLKWSLALDGARHREFARAAQMLEHGDEMLTPHDDEGLTKLLSRQLGFRRELQRLVTSRLNLLGMPTIDLVAGAKWLAGEPVLYEHRGPTPALFLRTPPFIAFSLALAFGLSGFTVLGAAGAVLAIAGLSWLVVKHLGWSDIVLTQRRLVLEGRVIDLTHVTRVLLVRPLGQIFPLSFGVELHRSSGPVQDARVRYASTELRTALTRLGLDTGPDWGPW